MANAKALAKATASSEKGKAAVTLPKAPFDIPKKAEKMPIAKKEAMDPVNHKALKGKHKDRDDTDIDNDGDTDSTDKYLHKRRKAISKNVKDGDEVEMNPKKKKDKGASTANADAEMAESTIPSVYARILEARKHNDKANPGSPAGEGMSPTAKKAKADMEAGAKMDDTEEKGHVDAAKAGRAGPGRKPRRNDNMKGDKSVIPSATKMKEAFAAVYSEAKLPGAFKLGDHAGHGAFGTKKQNHPDGSATLKLKLGQDHAKDKDGAHAYATKAADKLKSKGYSVHKVSVRKSEGGFGQPEHTASIHLSHNKAE